MVRTAKKNFFVLRGVALVLGRLNHQYSLAGQSARKIEFRPHRQQKISRQLVGEMGFYHTLHHSSDALVGALIFEKGVETMNYIKTISFKNLSILLGIH